MSIPGKIESRDEATSRDAYLTKLNLKNFKAFENLETINEKGEKQEGIDIKPITILCGPNNCGKSSIIQSLLLFKQTVESGKKKEGLIFKDGLIDLDSFENVIFSKDPRKSFTFSFGVSSGEDERILTFEINTENKVMMMKYETNKSALRYEFKEGRMYHRGLEGFKDNWEDEFTYTDVGEKIIKKRGTPVTLSLKSMKPDIIIFGIDEKESPMASKILKLFKEKLLDIPFIIENIFVNNLSYIGPLRVSPPRKEWTDMEADNIGIKGENVTSILSKYCFGNRFRRSDFKETYIYDYENNQFEKQGIPNDLIKNTYYWLDRMGVSGLDIESIGDGQGHSIKFDISGEKIVKENKESQKTTIKDIGFGISQVLPVIVGGLSMEKNSLLILEQPEIHMHPDAQLVLADFFICMALSGKRFIIETHSDHMINRLVRRIIEDEKNDLKNKIAIYFIQQNSDKNRGSTITTINIDERKGITNWPRRFFDQAGEENTKIIGAIGKKMGFAKPQILE